MTRGGTPTFVIELEGVDMTDIKQVYVTFRQGAFVLTKKKKDMILSNTGLTFSLKQKETLRFKEGTAQLQIRVLTEGGLVMATDIMEEDVTPVLSGEVIK